MSAATTIEISERPAVGGAARLGVISAAAAAGVLAVASVATPERVVASTWVRAVLVALWAVASVALATRGHVHLGLSAAVVAFTGGVCAATAADADLSRLHALAGALVPAAALHVELTMPDGVPAKVSRRNAIIAGYVLAAAVAAGLAAADRVADGAALAAVLVAVLLAGLPAAHHRYLRSSGLDRQRLQLVGCAVAIIVEVGLLIGALNTLVDWPHHAGELAAAATALLPLAFIAGTSHRITQHVDRVLVHTVSATGLTTVVVAVYFVVVIGLGRVPAANERSLLILSMVAAAVATLAYVPARARLGETANRLVYGERHPPDEVLRSWGSRLSRAIPMDELLLQLAESLRKVLNLRRAEVWTGSSGRLELAVAVPDREAPSLMISPDERPIIARSGVTGNAWLEVWLPAVLQGRASAQLRVAAATHSGELLGLLVMERAAGDDAFREDDDRVLAELARQVALALHNVQLDSALQESLEKLERANEDLRASRARIVATADAERRKIERNLHDGAQQHLVALAVNLRLARDIVNDDPAAAAEMLDVLASSVKDTIQELRDLAHGIYPPLLIDSGLAEALRAAANRNPLSVDVVVDAIGRYPTEVEAAIYFCCLEALQNAAKHAPDAHVELRVREDSGAIEFAITDDGPGYDTTVARQGHGFVNMSDRIGAIGGQVLWDSEPGHGSVVRGSVPLS